MNQTARIIILVLVLGCGREPVAPDPDAVPVLSATSEWISWEIAFPPGGVNFGIISCLGQQAQAYGGVSGRSRWVTRPDGSVMEKWWTLELWEDYHLVIGGETWWPIAHRARTGVTQYDESGAIVADHGVGAVFTLRNEVTGAVLDWPGYWQFQTDANGVVRVDFFHHHCRVRD